MTFIRLPAADAANGNATCATDFPTATVCDDFNSNVKDTSKWGPDIVVGSSPAFRNEGGEIGFLAVNAYMVGNVRRPALQKLPYDSDWIVEFEIYAGATTYYTGEAARFGLYLENSADPTDDIWLNGFAENGAGQGFEGRFVNNGTPDPTDRPAALQNIASLGVLQLAFDSTAKTVTLMVGTTTNANWNPILVTKWTPVATYDVTPWGMTDGSTFTINIIGDISLQGDQTSNSGELFRMTIDFPPANPPDAPIKMRASAISDNEVFLQWKDMSDNEAKFKVKYSLTGTSDWITVANVISNVNYTYHSNLSSNVTYFYKVRAQNPSGASAWSNIASATPLYATLPPLAPTDLIATATATNQVTLSWTDNSDNESGFRVQKRQSLAAPWGMLVMVGANMTNYVDKYISPGTTYYYRIKAYNPTGNSPNSNVAVATP